ncbi:NAD(P)H-hydrate dehydratase [Amnibacterium flavum]|uniref:ADP-dependent (S)-NAD(P)H-hydrate dehydratase n=1 Tax=Amnibacterium flavum TaxID=2173173 RepID=A0A2V1HND1_9MICO|nr:ADP/ATP-dependent (S)-NAD(P)H-hydrate dehydratase [Amnibacterium flavum]PVZ93911.1 NAD(P)H-hydrate dehydratase [Amnibacterium flavum]
MANSWRDWTEAETAEWLRVPIAGDDKYSRGVVGVVTGSARYPGAAVLGVEAAARSGAGMIRYLGDAAAARLVLQRRPEVVTVPGRVQSWLIGSGTDRADRSEAEDLAFGEWLDQGLPTVLDAGALDLVSRSTGPTVVTPHAGELVGMLSELGFDVERDAIERDPETWARRAADGAQVVVLLKGNVTHVVAPDSVGVRVQAGSPWLATAGSGDVLGGILGALLAAHSERIQAEPEHLTAVAAAAARLHGRAGDLASGGGPIVALDIAERIRAAFVDLAS